ncbi:MAG: hypothetical protein JXO48_05090 [Deltaproteobacteria bacterium]|nr:hypothetical protein [Deltaproteobacteria bacterium]
MAFTIEHECPQCGAPVELEEASRVLLCPYCDVRNFLFTEDYFRFVLPCNVTGKDILYAPYLRFRGTVYVCGKTSIGHRVVDITRRGAPFEELPVTLGLKPQAVKMKFVTPDLGGSFIRNTLRAEDVLESVGKRASSPGSGTVFHQASIGEVLSLIYLPLFIQDNRLFDAVTGRPVAELPGGRDTFGSAADEKPRWGLTVIATICPNCGWNLDGEKDSVVLTCSNCDTVWSARNGRFVEVPFGMVRGNKDSVYLPFWMIAARSSGVKIDTYADFIRVTDQPRVVQKRWEDQDMFFWVPAFKIRPQVFLTLCRQLTITQRNVDLEESIPDRNLFPVTLPHAEALQSLTLILADSAMRKKQLFPLLSEIAFRAGESTLIYLPFRNTGHEVVQEDLCIGIQKKTLEFGRFL